MSVASSQNEVTEQRPENHRRRPTFSPIVLICVGLVLTGTAPIILHWQPAPTADFFKDETEFQLLGCFFLACVVAAAIWLAARLDPEQGPAKAVRVCGFVLLAALLTDIHYYTVDILRLQWQVDQFNGVLLHTYQPPDQYRFLAQGTLWWMLLSNGNFLFSYLAYRFLFTFLLCQAVYMMARLYLPPRDSVIVVLLYAAFYSLSVRYSFGNLIDPMSHAAIIGTLVCCHQQRLGPLMCMFVLGMFIKETTIIIAPCYWIIQEGKIPWRAAALRVGALVVAGVAVFLACRVPFNFSPSFQSLNRTYGLMIYSNLGFARGLAQSPISVFQRYLHPALFIFMWVPFVIWQRKRIPRPLYFCALYLALASYLVNLCFGWNYESRNFIPALIVLLVSAVYAINRLTLYRQNNPMRH
jgi:hypothetical protein